MTIETMTSEGVLEETEVRGFYTFRDGIYPCIYKGVWCYAWAVFDHQSPLWPDRVIITFTPRVKGKPRYVPKEDVRFVGMEETVPRLH